MKSNEYLINQLTNQKIETEKNEKLTLAVELITLIIDVWRARYMIN